MPTPDNDLHNHLRGGGAGGTTASSLTETTRQNLSKMIQSLVSQRKLQDSNCFSQEDYEGLRLALRNMGNDIGADGQRGHFFGSIVRLAAVSGFFWEGRRAHVVVVVVVAKEC